MRALPRSALNIAREINTFWGLCGASEGFRLSSSSQCCPYLLDPNYLTGSGVWGNVICFYLVLSNLMFIKICKSSVFSQVTKAPSSCVLWNGWH